MSRISQPASTKKRSDKRDYSPKCVALGRSVLCRSIVAYHFDYHRPNTRLILAGMHGDEPKSVYVANKLLESLQLSPASDRPATNLVIVAIVNPDSYDLRKRRNANRVDINRNFPTENWITSQPRHRMFGGIQAASEPETRAVMKAITRFKPSDIVTIHSINKHRHCNNYDGPGKPLATAMHAHNGYPVRASIGYPTPGSFGNWAGVERSIPTVTLELPSHHSSKRCWHDNKLALLAIYKKVP